MLFSGLKAGCSILLCCPDWFRLFRLLFVVVSSCVRLFWSCLGCFGGLKLFNFLCVGSDS